MCNTMINIAKEQLKMNRRWRNWRTIEVGESRLIVLLQAKSLIQDKCQPGTNLHR